MAVGAWKNAFKGVHLNKIAKQLRSIKETHAFGSELWPRECCEELVCECDAGTCPFGVGILCSFCDKIWCENHWEPVSCESCDTLSCDSCGNVRTCTGGEGCDLPACTDDWYCRECAEEAGHVWEKMEPG